MTLTVQPNLGYALTVATAVSVVTFLAYWFKSRKPNERPINPSIKKHEKKVGDAFDIEDLMNTIEPGAKISLCRCWRSQKWPYCDGAHKEHNKCTGDNVGPVNITRKKTTS